MSHGGAQPPTQRTPTVSVSLDRLRQQLATTPSFSYSSMSAPEPSYILPGMEQPAHEDDDLDSLPSSLSSGVLSSSEADSADAQREWEESLEQIQLLLTMVLVPFAGKYLGRKFAYWSRLPFFFCPGERRAEHD